jgi:hypothetical protein
MFGRRPYQRRGVVRSTPQRRKGLRELLGPFVEMGPVEETVATDGEPFYRIRPGATEEEFLAVVAAAGQEGGAHDA